MEKTAIPTFPTEIENKDDEIQELIQRLPKRMCWSKTEICKYQGIWFPRVMMEAIVSFQAHFKPNDTDIILASLPKSGTTWTKALIYTIVNRDAHSIHESPLVFLNPHALVPIFEYQIYALNPEPNLESIPCPRLFSTHLHYDALPDSILSSKCKIVYVCRNPLDKFISHWNFVARNEFTGHPPPPLEEAFEYDLKGMESFGPFWDHMLGYWRASLENPKKILFLRYEDMKKNTLSVVKKLAEFMEFPFSKDEEKNGLIEEIARLCSIENLRSKEVNKTGKTTGSFPIKNGSFFRKGEVGDWVNYLTASMAEKMEKLMEDKFEGTGLTFELTSSSHQNAGGNGV